MNSGFILRIGKDSKIQTPFTEELGGNTAMEIVLEEAS